MPKKKSVKPLKEISINSLSFCLSISIYSLVTGIYSKSKLDQNTSKSVKGKSSKSPKTKNSGPKNSESVLIVIPTKEIEKISKYLSKNVPKLFLSELFSKVLKLSSDLVLNCAPKIGKKKKVQIFNDTERSSQLDDSVMHVFKIFSNKDIENLDFTEFLHLTMNWVDCRRLNKQTSQSAGLDYSWIETLLLRHFAEAAKCMPNLKSITWPHLLSGNLIKIIGQHFSYLKSLVLVCSCQVTSLTEEGRESSDVNEDLIYSLRSLFERCPGDFTSKSFGCPKLKRLILPNLDDETDKASIIIADALKVLKDIEVISGVSTLLSVVKLKGNHKSQSPLSLKTLNDYDTFKQRTVVDIKYIKSMLPKIGTIELRSPESVTQSILKAFPGTQELSLEYPNFESMVKFFPTLIYLNIFLDFNCPWKLILSLSKNCKQLKFLTLEHSTFRVDSECLEQLSIPEMPSLEYFKLIRSSFIEHVALDTLIKGCNRLKELYFTLSNDRNYAVDEFNDSLIYSVAPLMKNLEKFTAECLYKFNLYLHSNCILTTKSIRTLISNCPNIKYISHIDSWDVDDQEINSINAEIKKKNWDIEIS